MRGGDRLMPDPEPFVHPTGTRAALPYFGIGWRYEPRPDPEDDD